MLCWPEVGWVGESGQRSLGFTAHTDQGKKRPPPSYTGAYMLFTHTGMLARVSFQARCLMLFAPYLLACASSELSLVRWWSCRELDKESSHQLKNWKDVACISIC